MKLNNIKKMYVPIINGVQKNIAIECENIYNDIKSWSDYKK